MSSDLGCRNSGYNFRFRVPEEMNASVHQSWDLSTFAASSLEAVVVSGWKTSKVRLRLPAPPARLKVLSELGFGVQGFVYDLFGASRLDFLANH